MHLSKRVERVRSIKGLNIVLNFAIEPPAPSVPTLSNATHNTIEISWYDGVKDSIANTHVY